MKFEKEKYEVKTYEGEKYRTYKEIYYVEKPIKDQQKLTIYIPEAYYHGQTINGYNAGSAPIFIPNGVGGYRPGDIKPIDNRAVIAALKNGCVVVSPAIRGRGSEKGEAPALIVDYKAAIRFIKSIDIPGDKNKIITNGTSAGGALSAAAGMTGNHIDYQPYLDEIGAVDGDDSIYAASCYCPITNLDHADLAYEWQFSGIYTYNLKNKEGVVVPKKMSDDEIKVSKDLEKLFPDYVNSLNLKDKEGHPLTLDEQGNGSFKEYIKQKVVASVLSSGLDDISWVIKEDGKIVDIDFKKYNEAITRMKDAPAFDNLTSSSRENEEFGYKHFSDYSFSHSLVNGKKASEKVIKAMNPMCYLDDENATKCHYWRIRHGERDRDTSLAISAMLALSLENRGYDVDYFLPWDKPHSGDYDLDELFAWVNRICQ